MDDVARFQFAPPIRCCRQVPDSPFGVCGELATVRRPELGISSAAFFCGEHAQPGDVPIAGELLIRRISITMDVSFTGTSPMAAMARAEALARLETALESVGARLNLHAVTDVVGRYQHQAPRPAPVIGRIGG